MLHRAREAAGDESGFTVSEIIVASAILLLALTGFLSSLASLHTTSGYQSGRSRSLDDLRITAGRFAKDIRHSAGLTLAEDSRVVMSTYVNGVLSTVTYEVVTGGDGVRNLERTVSTGGSQVFVVKLTDDSIFTFDNDEDLGDGVLVTAPANTRQVGIHMETKPSKRHPAVVLSTEVTLRNVSS